MELLKTLIWLGEASVVIYGGLAGLLALFVYPPIGILVLVLIARLAKRL